MLVARLLAACATAALLAAAPGWAAGPLRDDDLKAEVAYNLLLFVDWPAPPPEMRLCVVAEGGLRLALGRQAGRPVRGRPLLVVPLTESDRPDHCAAVMIESGLPGLVERMGLAARGRPLLVIAEGETAMARGAMIGLVDNGGRIGFDINLAALKRSGLTASSKLLRLARVLKEREDD
jgi:hypothetical protein